MAIIDIIIIKKMRLLSVLVLLSFCTFAFSQSILEGFGSLGLDNKATPIQVFKSTPANSVWFSDVNVPYESKWKDNDKFEGAAVMIKTADSNSLLLRWDHDGIYVSHFSKEKKGNGFSFSGFEPLGGQSQMNERNDELAARELVRVCESYEGQFWQYDNQMTQDIIKKINEGDRSVPNGLFTGDNRPLYKQKYRVGVYEGASFPVIDCQTLIRLALSGIPYEYSSYADSSYQFRELNAYPWSVQLSKGLFNELAEWCIKSGLEIDPGKNFENLQAGDLVFWGTNSGISDTRTRKVSHVAMYTGRWVADKGYLPKGISGKEYAKKYAFPLYKNGVRIGYDTITMHPQTIEVDQAPDHLPNTCVVRHRFIDEEDEGNNVTSHKLSNVVMFARLPLRTKGSWSNTNPKDNPVNMIHTTGLDTGYRIDIMGDGKPFVLYIGSLNQAGTLAAINKDVVTGFMPYSKNAIENLPNKATVKERQYYDSSFKRVSNSDKACFVKHVISGPSVQKIQHEYMYNGVNQYMVYNQPEKPIIITGVLKEGETAIIDTKTGRIFTSRGSVINIDGTVSEFPGMKVIYCPTGQETFVTWE